MPITIGAKRESDFTDPVGMLADCHRRIERFLDALAAVAEQYKGGPLPEQGRATLVTSLRYFREAAPKHTADEEESLFPRLRQSPAAEALAMMGRIESLEQEHDCAAQVHDEVDLLGKQWLDRGTLPAEEACRLSTLLEQAGTLYRRHIQVEEAEIFPLATNLLTAEDRRSVGKEMASRRGLGEVAKS